jgi:hypothetical protein
MMEKIKVRMKKMKERMKIATRFTMIGISEELILNEMVKQYMKC